MNRAHVGAWAVLFFVACGGGSTLAPSQPSALATPAPTPNVKEIAVGDGHACAIMIDGSVRCWGANYAGQLGDGTLIARTNAAPVPALSSGVTSIAAGGSHSCAVVSGGVKCWGENSVGAVGDGTRVDRTTPVDVVGLSSGVASIAGGFNRVCALMIAGTVKCWGGNAFASLGSGMTGPWSLTPVDVLGLEGGVTAMSLGNFHSCFTLRSGVMRCAGDNAFGQIGDGTVTNRNGAVDVQGLGGNPSSIHAMGRHTCAMVAGAGKCWGANDWGQLGNGTRTALSTFPVNVVAVGFGIARFAGGAFSTCALTTASGVKCWGFNEDGTLGEGTLTSSTTPQTVLLGSASTVTSIYAAQSTVCVISPRPGARCWGAGAGNSVKSLSFPVVGLDGTP